MKAQLKAGAEIDFLSPEEFRKGLADSHGALLDKLGAGVKFIRRVEQKLADNNGTFVIAVGPPEGFVWSLRAVGIDLQGTNSANLYMNNVGNLSLIIKNIQQGNGWTLLPSETVILYPNDEAVLSNNGVAATANAVQGLYIGAIQVPIGHEYQLLG